MVNPGLSQTLVQAQVLSRQIKIARNYRGFKERQRALAHKHKIRISFPRGNVQVYISGSFTEPAWQVSEALRYSLTKNDLFVVVYVKEGDTFQLRTKAGMKMHPDFPVVMVRCRQVKGVGSANLVSFERGNVPRTLGLEQNRLGFDSGVFSKGKNCFRNEDAYFMEGTSVGIADGVSSWYQYGIDGGQFARELMCRCSQLPPDLSAQELASILSQAHSQVQAYGSSTALLAYLAHTHLYLSVLGDSVAMLLRWVDGKPTILFKSDASVHSFSTPFQLAHIPKRLSHLPFIQDSFSDALHYSPEVQAGDLLILGTDGLWDNLYDWEMMQLLETQTSISAQGIAEILGHQAYRNSKADNAGPFQEAVHQAYPDVQWRGGKPDDITVLVAWVISTK